MFPFQYTSTNTSQHESTQINTSLTRGNTSQTRVNTNQHESKTGLDQILPKIYDQLFIKVFIL